MPQPSESGAPPGGGNTGAVPPDFAVMAPAIVTTTGGPRQGQIVIVGPWVVCKGDDDGIWRAWPADDVSSIEWL